MKITFCGAAKTVTGSCYLVETDTARFIVDCGMFQGPKHVRQLNYRGFLFQPGAIDFVVLTHAHIDHSGLLPKLVKEGFSGKIFSTAITAELSAIMLPDSAHIQEHDVEIVNRKGRRLGRAPIEPLYTISDAEHTLTHFLPVAYGMPEQITDGVRLTFRDAGHILGSAIAEIEVTEKSKTTKLVFSGDLGQYHQPIVRDPEYIKEADYLFIESTYGLRNRDSFNKEEEFAKALNEIINQDGNCIIPAFAVGRTQLVLYYLVKLMRAGKIPKVPVFLDSPLGIAATKIFGRHPEVYDEDAKLTIRLDRIALGGDIDLRIAVSADDSKRINDLSGAKIIISSSGMADAGRILHHLKHNLWSAKNGVFFMGYQAEGTLGRRLLENAKLVKIVSEEIVVKAKIYNFEGFSAHADRDELLDWLKHFEKAPVNVFVMHGEPEVAVQFAKDITELLGYVAYAPEIADCANIEGLTWTLEHSDFVMPETTPDRLQNYFVLVESDYMDVRRRIETIVAKDPARTADVARRLEKLHNVFNKMITKLK